MTIPGQRAFDFEGRPSHSQALAIIAAALVDEGLVLGTPGQSARVRTVITPDGKLRFIVPDTLIRKEHTR